MSLEKFFQRESSAFLFATVVLFGVGLVFLGLFSFALWCGSATFVVRFSMVCGVVSRWSPLCLGYVDRAVREKKFQEKKVPIPFSLLLLCRL